MTQLPRHRITAAPARAAPGNLVGVTISKDPSIDAVLERLRADLGDDSFSVIDHWDGDLCAVGVARPDDTGYLVYVSTWPPERGTFNYECERPPAGLGSRFGSDALVEDVSYEDLRAAVRSHLHG